MSPIGRASRWHQPEDGSSDESRVRESDSMSGRAEAPGYVQYLDSDEDYETDGKGGSSQSEESRTEDGEEDGREKGMQDRMEKIAFSTLARARKIVNASLSQDDADSEEKEFVNDLNLPTETSAKRISSRELAKRQNKHAPTELSSRKPVSRRRTVVDGAGSSLTRDPRFSSLSASLPNDGLFHSSYGFVRDQQSREATELRAAYKKLKQREGSSAGPRARSELAEKIRHEKQQVEMALKRLEGKNYELSKRERETAVIRREKKKIWERVKEGGRPFHLKDSAKKQLILKDKFERLAGQDDNDGTGSSRKELKRAVERRRKKNAAKERRSMPLGGGSRSDLEHAMPQRIRRANASEHIQMDR